MIRWFFLRLCQSRNILVLNFWNPQLLSKTCDIIRCHIADGIVPKPLLQLAGCQGVNRWHWCSHGEANAANGRQQEGRFSDGFQSASSGITLSKDINRFQGLQLRRKRCTEQVAEVRRMKWIHIISENPDICEYNPEVVSAVIPVYLYKLMRHHINATCLEQKSESQSWNPFLGIWTLHFAKKGMWTMLSHIIRVPKSYGQLYNQAAPIDSFMQLPQCHGKNKSLRKKKELFALHVFSLVLFSSDKGFQHPHLTGSGSFTLASIHSELPILSASCLSKVAADFRLGPSNGCVEPTVPCALA